jgi:hypothetical protein
LAQTWLYTGTDWGTGANWSGGATPGAGQTATLNSAVGSQPVIAGNFTIGTVDLSAGTLTINTTRVLTVQTAFNVSNASVVGGGTISLGAG